MSVYRALVVDDEEINLVILGLYLEQFSIKVDKAANGKEALEMCKNNSYDIIFIDIYMPNMGGIETTIEIRKDEAYKNTPIIGFSGKIAEKHIQKCLEAGMDSYMIKPIDIHFVKKLLDKYLSDIPTPKAWFHPFNIED